MLVIAIAAPAIAQRDALTEAAVIELARARHPAVQQARAVASLAQADEVRAGLYPNPSLDWEREHLPSGSDSEREDSIALTMPIDFVGRRPAEKALARSGVSMAYANAAQRQSDAISACLAAFYDALAADRRVAIAARAVERMDEAARVVGRREAEGTSSGYERARVEIEAELARSQLHEAQMDARAARAALAAKLAVDPSTLALRGDFTTLDPAGAGGAEPRRSIVLLRAAEAEAREAHDAAGWAWFPTLSVSGGLRVAEATEARYGYVAGVSLSLPLFSSGQEMRAQTSAQQRLAVATARSSEHAMKVQLARAREVLVSARQEIARFAQVTGERVQLLERAAQSGYREGHRTLVELVDAQHARMDVEQRQLALELLAKRAEIALRTARGEFE